MIKLKFRDIENSGLDKGLSALSQYKLETKAAWNVMRLKKQVEKRIKEGKNLYLDIVKKHSELDENGNLKPDIVPEVKDADGNIVTPAKFVKGFILKKDEEENFKKAVEDFMDIEVEFKSHYIKLDDLANEKVEPQILEMIEPVIAELEVVEGGV